jgi:hypothetical protein
VLAAVTDRITRARTVVHRATPMPVLVRCAIVVCGVLAVVVAYPGEVVASRYLLVLLAVVALPALLPGGRAGTVAALVVVAGWIGDTTWYGGPVVWWRVLAVATALYLAHTLTALAAVLPYDAVVNLDVVTGWLVRALAVLLVSTVLSVIVLALTAEVAGAAFLAATLGGLAAAVAAAVVLARLLRRA